MIHNISRFIAALALLATAQGAWAVSLKTNITYVGLEASDVTVQVTYNNGATTETVTSGKTIGNIGGQNVSVSVTSTKGIGTTFSATYKYFGYQDKALDVNQDGNTCTFTTDATYDNTLNITVTINNRYTVHYDANNGSGTMADQEFLVDNAQSLSPCTFTYSVMGTQYAFCGWNTAADGSGTGYADGESVTNLTSGGQIITLYAQWAPYFMIHFDKNAEDATGTMANQKRDNTGSVKLSDNAYSREGYTFKCWNTKADGTGTSYTDCQSVGTLASRGQIVTLYAQWVAQYTVHFNANGGSGTMSDQTIGVGQAQALTANTFTRDGYYFAGWNTQADGTGTTYNDGQSVTDLAAANETINLYAQWRETVTADYVDANGDAHTLTDCKEITSGHMPTSLAGNYIVSESVTYTGKVTLSGNTTIILANGKTMSIGTEAAPLGGDYALYASGTNSLTIYGQSLDAATAGSLEVYSTWWAAVRLYEGSYAQHSGNVVVNLSGGSNNKSALKAGGSVTIDGGKLDASIASEGSFAIDASGNISISGGSVIANATGADSYGMRSGGNITLTWTRATDRITASGYQSTNGTVSLSKRFAFDDGGTVTLATTANMGGQTLRPAALVTFNANGGSDVAAQTLFVGTAATEPTPTRTGYDLSGWTLGNADYDFATLVTEDITLTAQWTPDPAHFSQDGDTYTIKSAAGWNVFCDCLNDNDTYNRFSGKTVRLDDDITVTRMAGSSKHDFCGTFDGGGNTLTFNHGTSDSYASDEIAAPFYYVSTVTVNDVETPAAICNLHVSGDIYTTAKYAAGIVGRLWGTVTIENCAVSTVIHSDINGDGTHGGIVALNSGTLSINGCVFDGKLLSTGTNATTNCGGFVGYGNGTITNSLYAPADLGTGETEVQTGDVNNHPSATFARDNATVTNSYYTRALGTPQGKAPRTVAAGTDVTIEAVALTGTATQYTVSGITAYSGGGLQRGETLYYGSDDQLSLTLSNSATPAPRGYQYGYTASAGTLSGSTLTMPDQDVTISVNTTALRSTGEPVTVAYINADGTPGETSAIALDGMESVDGSGLIVLGAGAYYVGTDIAYSNMLYFTGDATLILCDGTTMSVGSSTARINDNGIASTNNLTIYGQSLGTGSLSVYFTGIGCSGISADALLTINGGRITADSDGNYATALYCSGSGTINGGTVTATGIDGISSSGGVTINGGDVTANGDNGISGYDCNVTINGGNVSANGTTYGIKACIGGDDYYDHNVTITGGTVTATVTNADPDVDTYGIYADGNITLGWSKPTDRITASSYSGTVQVADGKKLHNGSGFLGGTLGDPAAALNGKTLRPAKNATYTTADGTAATADAILLDASDNSLPAGNYLATGTLNYTHGITLTGDVTLILADNCHMNVGTSGEGRFNGYGIDGYDSNTDTMYDLTITSEANGSGNGALSVYTKGTGNDAIFASELTINGGNITADTEGNGALALIAGHGIVTINGGTVSANATGSDADAIYASWKFKYSGGNVSANATQYAICAGGGNGTIALTWADAATDRITASSYSGTVTLARLFTDATDPDATDPADNYYGGTYTGDALNALAGKTLSGTTEVTLTEDNATQALAAINGMSGIGVTFNRAFTASKPSTICLPFDYTKKEGDGSFYAFTSIEHSGGEYIATMTEPGTTTLTANTPYLYLPSATGNVEFSGTPTTAIAAGTTTSDDWTFQGTYDEVKWDTAPTGIYGFSAQDVSDQSISQGEFVKVGAKVRIRPLRAYLKYKNGTENYSAAPTRGTTAELPDRIIVHLIGSDGNTTAIGTLDTRTGEVEIDTWYDLNGRKLSAKPTHRGIYINNGRKVVIK